MAKMIAGFFAASALVFPGAAALAQGTPAFRVPLDQVTSSQTMDPVYVWLDQVGTCSTTCGTGTRTTTYQCQDITQLSGGSYGPAESASSCTANVGAAPANTSQACTVLTGCTYDWVKPPVVRTVQAGRDQCGTVRSQFDPYCKRSDNTVLANGDHAMCINDRPDYDLVAAGNPDALGYDRTVTETAACTAAWSVSPTWSAWSNGTCSATTTRTRTVECKQEFTNATLPDSSCSAPKPAATETGNFSTCSYEVVGSWSAWSSTCSASATSTRNAECRRSDGTIVADGECTSRGLDMSESRTSGQFGSCTYQVVGTWSGWNSTCSDKATQTRNAQCVRSDGATVADSECTSRGMDMTETQTSQQFGGCAAAYGSWSSCASGTQSRSVVCNAPDGAQVPTSWCGFSGNATTQSQTCTPTVTYAWESSSWGPYSTCSSGQQTQTRSVVCRGSDGTAAPDSSCTGAKPASAQSQACTAPVTYSWEIGSWGPYSDCSTTGQRTQTRSVVCRGSDGTAAADSACTDPKPATADASACPIVACGSVDGSGEPVWQWTGEAWEDYGFPNWEPAGGMNGSGPSGSFNKVEQTRRSFDRKKMVSGITAYGHVNTDGSRSGQESCPSSG
ncbi:hypothetical protein [Sphingosinicella sp. BN140058]|uniref:hypothetical protein n=1 Tax=Sphingosinicella sp. BN140058 TaxID=1892855 RepID=UPI001013480F|nr:hypothetical protein [Sphingosinicella sp. BN140058]QAY80345.1 hypothetical protein ETR14_27260 [Sphingosinicella sp. BN140058]